MTHPNLVFHPQTLTRSLYGPDRKVFQPHWLRTKRLTNTTFHSFHPTLPGCDLTQLGFDVHAVVASAVRRLRRRFANLRIASWGIWPDRLEVLSSGGRVERNVAIGYIKSTVTHRCAPTGGWMSKSVWVPCSYLVPLLSAEELLRCHGHLTLQMECMGPDRSEHGVVIH